MNIQEYSLGEQGIERLKHAFRLGLNEITSARFAGISLTTYKRYMHDIDALLAGAERTQDFTPSYVEFLYELFEAIYDAKVEGEMALAEVIRNSAIQKGSWQAAKYLLEKKHGWGDKNQQDIELLDLSQLDPEDLTEEQLNLAAGFEEKDANSKDD
jgi:hypothetical protein